MGIEHFSKGGLRLALLPYVLYVKFNLAVCATLQTSRTHPITIFNQWLASHFKVDLGESKWPQNCWKQLSSYPQEPMSRITTTLCIFPLVASSTAAKSGHQACSRKLSKWNWSNCVSSMHGHEIVLLDFALLEPMQLTAGPSRNPAFAT